ncbi:MAG: glycoside hydrolase family 65, partial [Firmicutes bacterium]|nr:glycoside hydrolase family 65 [Bacillota bacterium]
MLNRYALVSRHNPVVTEFAPDSPLSVGNGEFVFTADPTGLQTFAADYEANMPLCTMAHWGWHTTPPRDGRRIEPQAYRLTEYETYGRLVGYATGRDGQEEEYHWLRQNPHRLHLGRIGLAISRPEGAPATRFDLAAVRQTLDLWRGMLESRFTVDGELVHVRTCCHPTRDLLGVFINSPLFLQERLAVSFAFPYGSPEKTAAAWGEEDRHRTEIISAGGHKVTLLRVVDATTYFVTLAFSGAQVKRQGKHCLLLTAQPGREQIEFTVEFTPSQPRVPLPTFTETAVAAATSWESFWSNGGLVELARSRDPRALELERRVVLSQYLTAIQCGGSLPPAETGLTCNSWYGKFHLEMHWWHAVHFAYWNRIDFLERSLWWYQLILPQAQKLAQSQGYTGARWPKMVGPEGWDSPSPIGPLLIWQQPHPIYYAELCYRAQPSRQTLERYRELVFQTAEFLASYAVYEQTRDRYVLGPPVIPAQECHRPESTLN